MNTRALLFMVVLALACNEPRPEGLDRPGRRRGTKAIDRTDTSLPMDIRPSFVPPAAWEHVRLPSGVEFSQPQGFTVVNAPAVKCDADTPPADSAILHTELADRWPLTLAMRRGDLSRLAYVNGFTLDSTDVAAHGQKAGDSTRVRRGEGWILLSGRASTSVLFAAIRAPAGCYLAWAARGSDISIDTLGLVLGTVKFGVPSPASSTQ